MQDKVLVVIVTYNAMQWIDKCIQSTNESEIPLDLFIIDNMSTDETVKHIKEKYSYIKLIQSKTNLGFGAANNIGLQYAIDYNYSYVYLLNQDAWIQPNTIKELVETSKVHPEFGILSPMQYQANEIDLDLDFNVIFSKYQHSEAILSVTYVMAAHWLISRECLLAIGGFSPTFYHYGEDDNYCDRVIFKGFKIGIIQKAIAIHDRGGRACSAEKKLYLSFVRTLVYLSGFERSSAFAIYGLICDCIKFLLKEKSFSFATYIIKVIFNFKQIKRNKRLSLSSSAFLSKRKD